MPTSREQSASLHILLDNTWLEDKLTLLFLKKWACQETQLSTQKKKATSATPSVLNTRSPLFHAACLPCDMAIFINSLPPSCCFMLTWRMVWKSQQRYVNPRGTCLLSFLEQMKCHELQWHMGQGHFTHSSNENASDIWVVWSQRPNFLLISPNRKPELAHAHTPRVPRGTVILCGQTRSRNHVSGAGHAVPGAGCCGLVRLGQMHGVQPGGYPQRTHFLFLP